MSLKGIAKQLGLSITTVSRALNGYSDVSQETRERITAEANRLGYRPNAMARRLKMGKIDAVGLVYPSRLRVLNNSAFLAMIGSISTELSEQGVDLLLVSDDIDDNRHSFIRLIESCRVDALIVAHTEDDDGRLNYLSQHHLPFLALGRSNLAQPYAWFDFDNRMGSSLAVKRLAALGHQRIAFLGSSHRQTFVKQRLQGYLDGVKECGLTVNPDYIKQAEPNRRDGFLATQNLLALEQPPTAIITDCNVHGDGTANALERAGVLGRNGVSLIVYDGLPDDSLINISVTPIVQATREKVGKQIADMTLALIAGDAVESLQVLWQPVLGIGDTDNPPADTPVY